MAWAVGSKKTAIMKGGTGSWPHEFLPKSAADPFASLRAMTPIDLTPLPRTPLA